MNNENLKAVVCARSKRLKLKGNYQKELKGYLKGIAHQIAGKNLPLIGHIKLSAVDNRGNIFYYSVTDCHHISEPTGELRYLDEPVDVKLNAILYGVEKDTVEEIVDGVF